MKITLISPPLGESGRKSKGLPIAPPVLEYLAGLTQQVRPGAHEVALVDANTRDFDPQSCDADLVGITVLTPEAPWAYRTADALRARGIQVLVGGIHIRACPEEAAGHAYSIVIGEVEEIWGDILDDAEKGQLKRRYDGGRPQLEGLPRPVTNLLPDRYVFGSFFTFRGCPHSCAFCSVHENFGHAPRLRPIDEVVSEVAASRRRLFWNIDDNCWGFDIDRSIRLYREMARQVKGKWWFGQGDLGTMSHPRADELLAAARGAGMRAVMVGYESESPEVLRELNAAQKQGDARADAIRKIRAAGIEVVLFVMVGSRADHLRDFERISELCDALKVAAHPVMTTPLPGTQLYEAYRPFLIPGLDWDLYDGNRSDFYHDDPAMTPEAREAALIALRKEIFTVPKILRRMTKVGWRGFPMAHVMSWAVQYPLARAFQQQAAEHHEAVEPPASERP